MPAHAFPPQMQRQWLTRRIVRDSLRMVWMKRIVLGLVLTLVAFVAHETHLHHALLDALDQLVAARTHAHPAHTAEEAALQKDVLDCAKGVVPFSIQVQQDDDARFWNQPTTPAALNQALDRAIPGCRKWHGQWAGLGTYPDEAAMAQAVQRLTAPLETP